MSAGFTVTTLRQSNNPPSGKAPLHQGQKRPVRWKIMSTAWSSLSLTSRGLCTKNLSQQAKMWISGSAATFCGDCVTTCEEVAPNWREQTWLLHHDNAPSNTSVFIQQFLAKNKMVVIRHPTHSPDLAPCDFFLFPKMKLKLKGCRLIPMRRYRPNRRVLDTLIEKDFQKAFQKWRRRWDRCLHVERELLRGWRRPIGLIASFTILTASVRKILDTTS